MPHEYRVDTPAVVLYNIVRPQGRCPRRNSECANMIGSLAEGLAGVVVGEVAQANRQRQGDGPRYLEQQHQRQQASGPLAGFTESVGEACNRAMAMAITASSQFAHVCHGECLVQSRTQRQVLYFGGITSRKVFNAHVSHDKFLKPVACLRASSYFTLEGMCMPVCSSH